MVKYFALELPTDYRLPNWETAELAPEVRVAWMRTQIVHRPASLADFPVDFVLHAAVRDIPIDRISTAQSLVENLVRAADATLQRKGIDYLDQALYQGMIHSAIAHELLTDLLDCPNDVVVAQAIRKLRSPWAVLISESPQSRLVKLLNRTWDVAKEAVLTLAARGDIEVLVPCLEREEVDPYVQRQCIEVLAEQGQKQHIRIILERALSDLLFFGPTAIQTLLMLRRRGIVCSKEEAAAVFGIYIESIEIDEDEIAEILSPYADVCLDGIEVVLSSAHPPWTEVVNLLAAFGVTPTVGKLQAIVSSQACRDGWAPAIRALGELQIVDVEELILSRLLDEPGACLDALTQIGTSAAVSRLKLELLNRSYEVNPAWYERAAILLYQLEPCPEHLAALTKRGLLSADVLASLPLCASMQEIHLLGDLAQQPGHPLRENAIRSLGQVAGIHGITLLARCLDDRDEEIRSATHRAIQHLGRRLYRHRVLRPSCLVTADDEREAGSLLLADCLLMRLKNKDLDDQQLQWFLETLADHPHPHVLRTIRRLLRHRNPQVKKQVLHCLGAQGMQKAVPWILPFAETKDIYVLRQALIALGDLRAHWAAPQISASLDHPNMNIKKTAIAALTGTENQSIVPKLVFWLSHHDNPGLREELVSLLKRVLGPDYVPVISSALDRADQKRPWELLCQALSHGISLQFVVNKVQSRPPWAPPLLTLIYAGAVSLADSDVVSLEAELSRRGLEKHIPKSFEAPSFAPHSQEGQEKFDFAKTIVQLDLLLETRQGEARDTASADQELNGLLSRIAVVNGTDRQQRKLRRHIPRLFDLYPLLSKEAQQGALAIVSANVSRLSPLEKLRAAWIAKDSWEGEPASLSGALLRETAAVLTTQQARYLLADERFAADGRAVNTVLWSSPAASELQQLLITNGPQVLDPLVETGRHTQCFDSAQRSETLNPVAVIDAVNRHLGASAALDFTGRLLDVSTLADKYLPSLLSRFDGAKMDDLLNAIQSNKGLSFAVRTSAISALTTRPSRQNEAVLKRVLITAPTDLRATAAGCLVQWCDTKTRATILDQYLNGHIGQTSIDFDPTKSELQHLAAAIDRKPDPLDDQALRRILDLFRGRASHTAAVIQILVAVWERGLADSSPMARSKLRGIPVSNVLPVVYPQLKENRWAYLDILGSEQRMSPTFSTLFNQTNQQGKEMLLAYFSRHPDVGPFYSPDLSDVLLSHIAESSELTGALAVLAKLTDWYDGDRAAHLVRSLKKGIRTSTKREAIVVNALLQGTQGLPAAIQIKQFAALGCITQYPDIMARIAEVQLDEPNAMALLPKETQVAIGHHIRSLTTDNDPELVRKVMTYLAKTQGVEETVDLLQEMLSHRSPRVRLQAHRLLQRNAPRDRYLRATAELLSDDNPDIVRRAIRALTFSGDTDSLKRIIGLLHHKERTVRRAAHQGLVAMGETAVSALHRAAKQQRPDRRGEILNVLAEITGG